MLCKEAGISRSTFYRYYDDIYEVLEEQGNLILDRFLSIKSKYQNPLYDRSKSYLSELLKCIDENSAFFSCVLLKERNGPFLYQWKKIIRQDLMDKYVSANNCDEKTLLRLEMITHGALGIYSFWIGHRDTCRDRWVLEMLINIWDENKI